MEDFTGVLNEIQAQISPLLCFNSRASTLTMTPTEKCLGYFLDCVIVFLPGFPVAVQCHLLVNNLTRPLSRQTFNLHSIISFNSKLIFLIYHKKYVKVKEKETLTSIQTFTNIPGGTKYQVVL